MNTYVFHLGAGNAAPSFVLRFTLHSDLDASVRAFDLLRSHADCEWVRALADGETLLTRTRAGGKQMLTWLRPRPPPVSSHPARPRRLTAWPPVSA